MTPHGEIRMNLVEAVKPAATLPSGLAIAHLNVCKTVGGPFAVVFTTSKELEQHLLPHGTQKEFNCFASCQYLSGI